MRFYTVHLRRPLHDPTADVVLIKEGFSWPAFFFAGVWALVNRLWLVALALIGLDLATALATPVLGLHPFVVGVVGLGLACIVGFVGNDLKRWTLEGRGFGQAAVVAGRDRDAALERFFSLHDILTAGQGR